MILNNSFAFFELPGKFRENCIDNCPNWVKLKALHFAPTLAIGGFLQASYFASESPYDAPSNYVNHH